MTQDRSPPLFVYVCFCNCLFKCLLPLFSWNAHGQGFLSLSFADPHGVLNGNSCNGDSKTNNKAKNLQDSLAQKVSSPSGSGKQPIHQPSPPNMLNGRNSSMKEDSIHENSSSFLGQSLGNKTPPVPARASHTNHTPVPLPRTSVSVTSRGTCGGQRAQESPKLLRNMRAEATSSLTPPSRGSGQGIENSSQSSHKPSPVKFSPTAPSSPRVRGSSLQKRSPSPMRDQQLSHVDVPQRLRTPDAAGSTRELPPLGPYTNNRVTPGSQSLVSSLTSQGLTSKPVPESPQGPRKLIAPSKAEAVRALYAQSPSSLSGLEKEPGGRQLRPGPGCAIMPGLVSLSGSSPLASPHRQRKTPCMTVEQSLTKPYTRERKNSISEISDNEDELLEYHRWQREERLREQEMEKLVSDQHSRYDFTVDTSAKKITIFTSSTNLDSDVDFPQEAVKKTFAADLSSMTVCLVYTLCIGGTCM